MAVTTVQAEASQCLFEFLHMEVVSHICCSQKDSVKKVLGCLSLHWFQSGSKVTIQWVELNCNLHTGIRHVHKTCVHAIHTHIDILQHTHTHTHTWVSVG